MAVGLISALILKSVPNSSPGACAAQPFNFDGRTFEQCRNNNSINVKYMQLCLAPLFDPEYTSLFPQKNREELSYGQDILDSYNYGKKVDEHKNNVRVEKILNIDYKVSPVSLSGLELTTSQLGILQRLLEKYDRGETDFVEIRTSDLSFNKMFNRAMNLVDEDQLEKAREIQEDYYKTKEILDWFFTKMFKEVEFSILALYFPDFFSTIPQLKEEKESCKVNLLSFIRDYHDSPYLYENDFFHPSTSCLLRSYKGLSRPIFHGPVRHIHGEDEGLVLAKPIRPNHVVWSTYINMTTGKSIGSTRIPKGEACEVSLVGGKEDWMEHCSTVPKWFRSQSNIPVHFSSGCEFSDAKVQMFLPSVHPHEAFPVKDPNTLAIVCQVRQTANDSKRPIKKLYKTC